MTCLHKLDTDNPNFNIERTTHCQQFWLCNVKGNFKAKSSIAGHDTHRPIAYIVAGPLPWLNENAGGLTIQLHMLNIMNVSSRMLWVLFDDAN